jgi:tight adherence protein B
MNEFSPYLVCCLLTGCAAFAIAFAIDGLGMVLATLLLGRLARRMKELRLVTPRLALIAQIWAIGGTLLVLVMGVGFERWLVAAVLSACFVWLPRWIGRILVQRRERLLRDQLASACFTIACGVRAGLSLPAAVQRVATEATFPLAREFECIDRAYMHGQPLRDAIEEVRRRIGIESFALLAMGIGTAMERGGPLDETLERISHSIHEAQRLERKLDTETASGRRTILVLAIFPAIFLAGFYVLDPSNVRLLFTTFPGQIAFSVAFTLTVVAVRWAVRILDHANGGDARQLPTGQSAGYILGS